MGAHLICEIHGGTFRYFQCCNHINEEWKQGIFNAVANYNAIFQLHLCEKCYELGNFSQYHKITIDDFLSMPEEDSARLEKQYGESENKVQLYFYCYNCFLDGMLIWARKNGHNDPFEVFDNTLAWGETTKELEKYLETNYPFKPCAPNEPYWKSLKISGGEIDKPLTITIYHVIDESEQKRILDLIDRFFESIPQKQRLVRFFEALIIQRRDNGATHLFNEEVLLAEYLTK